MKKTALALALAFGISGAFAQDLTSKKGEPYLPEAGDWSIGIDANPLLNYMGNLFSGNTGMNNAPTWNFMNATQTIIGKMFTDEATAYRGILRIGMWSNKTSALIPEATSSTFTYPNLPPMTSDEMKSSGNFIGLGGGLEMRRGKTRLQGFYGGDAMFWMYGGKDTYTYGNALAPGGTPPVTVNPGTTTNFGSNMVMDPYGNNARITEEKMGTTIGFGVRGFIGAEYFIFPKISIAGEFGWGLGISKTGAGSTSLESTQGTQVGTMTMETGTSGGFWLDTDQNMFGTNSATLRLNFHF
jgi:hypothetical protein